MLHRICSGNKLMKKWNGFDFGDFKITKREILASISIIAVLLLIGFIISGKISDHAMDKNEKYNKAVLQQLIVDEKSFIERPIRNSQENQQTVRSRITPHLYYPSFHQLNTQFHIRTDIVRFVCMIA